MSYKRNCLSYMVTVGLFSVMLSVYIVGLKKNKQLGTSFNLKAIKVKRDARLDAWHDADEDKNPLKLKQANGPGSGNRRETGQGGDGRLQRVPEQKVVERQGHRAGHVAEWQQQQQQQHKRHDAARPGNGDGRDGRPVKPAQVQLPPAPPQQTSPLPVYIVEEHHEVMPYWFRAASRGVIPKTGNTLIHIDGHSDMAPPHYVPGYPFFKWPLDNQLKYLMQSNDAFILASAMAGLLDRYIWIWPDWDNVNHKDEPHYGMSTYQIGWVSVNDGDRKSREFCMCARNGSRTECKSSEAADDTQTIPADSCNIKKTLIVEQIHESKALAYFGKPGWATPKEKVFLDIDEDFFGCSYAITPILVSNLSIPRINRLNNIIKSSFCPANATHDAESDKYLMYFLAVLRTKRACDIDLTLRNTSRCRDIKKIDTLPHLTKRLQTLINTKLLKLCEKLSIPIDKLVRDLSFHFSTLKIQQMRAMQVVGFCASTSPMTFITLYNERVFGVCYGANTPGDTMVLEHMPTRAEITQRAILLREILGKVGKQGPRIVTVSRSVRDGYTPRMHFQQIENSVLGALNNTLNRRLELHYDENLLGGKAGWPSRHKA